VNTGVGTAGVRETSSDSPDISDALHSDPPSCLGCRPPKRCGSGFRVQGAGYRVQGSEVEG